MAPWPLSQTAPTSRASCSAASWLHPLPPGTAYPWETLLGSPSQGAGAGAGAPQEQGRVGGGLQRTALEEQWGRGQRKEVPLGPQGEGTSSAEAGLVAVVFNRIYRGDGFNMTAYDLWQVHCGGSPPPLLLLSPCPLPPCLQALSKQPLSLLADHAKQRGVQCAVGSFSACAQWIEYYLYAGVERVYWYDMARSAAESQRDVLEQYRESGQVHYKRFHSLYPPNFNIHSEQDNAVRHFLRVRLPCP